MFLRATLNDGTQVVSEFGKLGRVERYVTQVFQGYKPFNAWEVVGKAHPVSGEQVLFRTRRMLNGQEIRSIEEVTPTVENHGYLPTNFELKVAMPKGTHYVVPAEGGPEGVEPGVEFPIHRDDVSLRRYVILRVGDPEADPASEAAVDQRHYLDPEGQPVGQAVTEERPEWEDEDEDFDY